MAQFRWLSVTVISLVVGFATAQPQRTSFVVDNTLPSWSHFEAGLEYLYTEQSDDQGFTDIDTTTVTPVIRYGLQDKLALKLEVPYKEVDSTVSGSESGIGDVVVGAQLRAWEDVFDYPFILPHLDVALATGDEDKGLGHGDTVFIPGVSFGVVVHEVWTWIADVRYRIQGNAENQILVSGAVLYSVSDELSLLLETRLEDNAGVADDDTNLLIVGGMAYDWTENMRTHVSFGGSAEGTTDVIARVRASYSF